jgi:2-dehydropantoate 2-reductase
MNPRDGGFADLVLFCVKAYDTETAAERLRPTIGPETVILPVQNGIDSAERIGRVVGSGHVIGGTAGVSSVLEAPGIIDHRSGPDEIRLGELDGSQALASSASPRSSAEPGSRPRSGSTFGWRCGRSSSASVGSAG